MSGQRRCWWGAVLVGAALAGAGCSSSDEGGPAAASTPPPGAPSTEVEAAPPPPPPLVRDEEPEPRETVEAGEQNTPPPPAPETPPPPPPVVEPTLDTGKPVAPLREVSAGRAGWKFYGAAEGLPRSVLGVSEDEGGNLWVAGGTEGLFLLRKGATTFERFGMEHGLQPYGLWKGKVPVGAKHLEVIAVTGGPPGVAWVGYAGMGAGSGGPVDCESEFYRDDVPRDPNVFKSGDADRVELRPDGSLRVVHYDIHSVAHSVPGYGHREKVCSIYRIVWDKARNALWLGGNHGFSWAEPDYDGNAECRDAAVRAGNAWVFTHPDGTTEERQRCRNGVMEHVHPSIFMPSAIPGEAGALIAGKVKGIAVRHDTGDVWFGSAIRTSLFRIMTNGAPRFPKDAFIATGAPWSFEAARKLTADKSKWKNRLDIWPDALAEPNAFFTPAERRDDQVSGMAFLSDKTLWVSSSVHGLAQLDENGVVLRRLFEGTRDARLEALGRDTADESLWLGQRGAGLSRLQGEALVRYADALGELANNTVSDIQFAGSGRSRRVLVGFSGDGGGPGGVGVYSGE